MKKIIALFSIIAALVGVGSAQTMHVICYANTVDKNIGKSVVIDCQRINSEVSFAASAIGYKVQFYNGIGESCTRERLLGELDNLYCGPKDIIMFYYSGHGGRSSQDSSPFPQMCLKYGGYEQEKWVPVHQVVEKLSTKGAQLTIVLSDCCNKDGEYISAKSPMMDDGGQPVVDEIVKQVYRKLFIESKGMIVATSSKSGQTSGCNESVGGFFTWALFDVALYNAGLGKTPATWNDVLAKTTSTLKNGGASQVPYYEVKLNSSPASAPAPVQTPVATTTTPTPAPIVQPATVVSADNSFAQELSSLFATGMSKEARLARADQLADQYFTPDAKVATVGRNRTTIIDYENARDFLRRIAVSTLVRQVSVIQESTASDGRRNFIKVQEIR